MREEIVTHYTTEEYQRNIINVLGDTEHKVGIHHPTDVSIQESHHLLLQKVVKLIPRINKSTRVLFLDSGSGAMARLMLSDKECKIECLHSDTTTLAHNERFLDDIEEKLRKKINASLQYFEDLPYPGETFDIVWAIDCLPRSTDKLRVFREVHRTLKPEGRFVISEAVRLSSEEGIEDVLPCQELFTIDQYDRLARKTQYQNVYKRTHPEYLKAHHQMVLDQIEKADFDCADLKNDSEQWLQAVEAESVAWSLMIFQKLNA